MRLCITCILLLAFLAAIAHADTVELKTGEKIEGVFKEAGPAGAVIEVGGQPITFTLDKVRAIYLGATPAIKAGPAPAEAAIDALRSLRSVTTSGINYRDYSTRVLDAKVRVDKYRDSGANDPARDAIVAAMKYYEMGSQAWGLRVGVGGNASGLGRMVEIGEQIRVDSCPDFAGLIANADAFYAKAKKGASDQDRNAFLGSMAGGSVGTFWKCGADKVAQAEAAK
jgi:hypothetical protein